MSEDRTLFWGTEGEHNYASGEGGSGPPDGNFVVAETDAGTRLFEWDGTQWVSRGAVNMDGNDIEEVGSLTTEVAGIDDLESFEAELTRLSSLERQEVPKYEDKDEMLDQTDKEGSIGVINGRLYWRTEDT